MKLLRIRFTVLLALAALSFEVQADPGSMAISKDIVPVLAPFAVSSTLPANGASAVNPYFTVTFNKPVLASTINKNTLKLNCNWSPAVEANVQVLNPTTAIFYPLNPLPFNVKCHATVTTGVQAASNHEPLAKDYEWTFLRGTRNRDECQLDACKRYFAAFLELRDDPSSSRKCYFQTDPNPQYNQPDCETFECVTISKPYYDAYLKPLMDACVREHAGDTPKFQQNNIEGTLDCQNMSGLVLPDPAAIEDMNHTLMVEGDLASENRAGFCYYGPSFLEKLTDACGKNSCFKKVNDDLIHNIKP